MISIATRIPITKTISILNRIPKIKTITIMNRLTWSIDSPYQHNYHTNTITIPTQSPYQHNHHTNIITIQKGSKSDFRLFSNSQDHSWDQCISEENFFFEREGVGVLEYSDPKWHWNAPFTTPVAKKSIGGGPRPRWKRNFHLGFIINFNL